MSLAFSPALRHEVKPNFALHDPQIGWISASYLDGTSRLVDLSTVLKEAHLIKRVSLRNSVSSISLYRLLLSISYADFKYSNPDEWLDDRVDKVEQNLGFNPQFVDSYFAKHHDRFYLIHPDFPFLQDASVYTQYNAKAYNEHAAQPDVVGKDLDNRRKVWSGALSPISGIYPNAINITKEGNPREVWGLPVDDIYDTASSESDQISILMTALLHQRYSHASINRGARPLIGLSGLSDTHLAAHAFRCATGYVIETGSLYQTLLTSMEYFSPEELDGDIPEWEREVDETTGTLALKGYNIEYTDIVKFISSSKTGPRSSVNMTQMAVLLVPDVSNDLSQIKQIRRPAFNFKHHLAPGSTKDKLPFPITWNPFVAIKDDGRALKLVTEVSEATSMGSSSIFKVPFLNNEAITKPYSVTSVQRDDDLRNVLPASKRTLRVFVFAADATKEKDYADFILVRPDTSALIRTSQDEQRIANWMEFGGYIRALVNGNISSLAKRDGTSIDVAGANYLFWQRYQSLFFGLNASSIEPVSGHLKEIVALALEVFDNYTSSYFVSRPLVTSGKRGLIQGSIYKKGKTYGTD